jgi:hypothetical protein
MLAIGEEDGEGALTLFGCGRGVVVCDRESKIDVHPTNVEGRVVH